jgi:hypothetical protein
MYELKEMIDDKNLMYSRLNMMMMMIMCRFFHRLKSVQRDFEPNCARQKDLYVYQFNICLEKKENKNDIFK